MPSFIIVWFAFYFSTWYNLLQSMLKEVCIIMNKGKISGSLRIHLIWPVILIPFLAVMTIHLFIVDFKTGAISAIYIICYAFIALLLYNFNRKTVMANLINYAIAYNDFTRLMVKELDIPYATLDTDGNIMWYNDAFSTITGESAVIPEHISSVFPEIRNDLFPLTPSDQSDEKDMGRELTFSYGNLYLRAVLKQTSVHDYDFSDDMENISLFENSDTFVTLYLYDETQLKEYAGQIQNEDIVMGLLYIDDYDEVLANCDELTRSLLMALVERQIAKNMHDLDGIYRKMEKDRYFFIFRHKYLNIIKENKFSILDDVRNVKLGNDDIRITISIGIGVHADSYAKRYEFARTAIDLALGRGGDQAVIKDGEKIIYYGGSNIQKESNTRVRARVKAHALNELIVAAEQIFIMGHANCDVDSFGAAIGIYRIARALERNAQIIVDTGEASAIKQFLSNYNKNSYYDKFIISPEEARYKMTPDTLLIIVDVNKVSHVQCPPLLEQTHNIVVIDHHRQTDERIKNPVLSYIEPYASSASEMVTEFFRYINDGIRPRPLEADTLYSGIMVDTNNFSTQVGVRTFEAVAYLKRCGADITRIHKLFRSEPDEYMIRARAISNANIFLDSFVITTIPGVEGNTPVIGAKVANSLLEMNGIKASFVLSEYKSRIYINARSIDEVNVQLIMERLGGGGHVSSAAAQLNTSLDMAINTLKDVISTMLKEGDLK